MNISKSRIKKLGRSIRHSRRDSDKVKDPDLEMLQAYRISFQASLNSVFDYLVERSKLHYKGSLAVYRLKRIDTIIRKISREATMDFSKMQDIAGCRAIVGSERQIYNIVDDFKKNSNFEIVDEVDYIANPRDTGYISYHLVVRPINQERIVEIQLRTRSHHYWATLVEITDVIFGIKLKEGEDHPELYEFHKLLAKGVENLSLEDKKKLVEIDRKNQIISKLSSLFKSNYYISIDRWSKARKKEDEQYLIMELDSNLSPIFSFYNSFLDAEDAYFKKFTLNEPNMVLVHLYKSDFEKIGLAYSNYVLTSHPSIRLYLEILQGLILEFYVLNKLTAAAKDHLKYYNTLINRIVNSFESEIEFIDEKMDEFNRKEMITEDDKKQYLYLVKDWQQNLQERMKYIKKTSQEFFAEVNEVIEAPTKKKGVLERIIGYFSK